MSGLTPQYGQQAQAGPNYLAQQSLNFPDQQTLSGLEATPGWSPFGAGPGGGAAAPYGLNVNGVPFLNGNPSMPAGAVSPNAVNIGGGTPQIGGTPTAGSWGGQQQLGQLLLSLFGAGPGGGPNVNMQTLQQQNPANNPQTAGQPAGLGTFLPLLFSLMGLGGQPGLGSLFGAQPTTGQTGPQTGLPPQQIPGAPASATGAPNPFQPFPSGGFQSNPMNPWGPMGGGNTDFGRRGLMPGLQRAPGLNA